MNTLAFLHFHHDRSLHRERGGGGGGGGGRKGWERYVGMMEGGRVDQDTCRREGSGRNGRGRGERDRRMKGQGSPQPFEEGKKLTHQRHFANIPCISLTTKKDY